MESKDNFFYNNIKDNQVPLNIDPLNQNSLSGKIINMNNSQQELFDFYESSEKEKEKDSVIEEELGNDKKMFDFLTKDLINKMTLISPIPKQKLPQKMPIIENLMQEKKESFEEKDEEDLSPDEEEEEESDDSDIEDFKPKKENIKYKSEKEINKKRVHFKEEENKDKNNDNKKDKENNKNSLNRTFSYNINDKNNKENCNASNASSFFEITSKHLKKELEHEHSYYSDINKSHNYLPKFSLELNINENNNNSIRLSNNNISQNNESLQNDNLNFNINPNQFFGVYNQMNFEKNNVSNDESTNTNKTNNLINFDGILNNSKNESMNVQEQSQKEKLINLSKANINNIQPYIPKNTFKKKEKNKQLNPTQQFFNNNFSNSNNYINFNNNYYNQNENYLFNNNNNQNNNNINPNNNFNQNAVNLQYHNFSNNSMNKQIPSKMSINSNIFDVNINKNNLMIPQKYFEDIKIKMPNMNNHPMNFQNVKNHINNNIPKSSINMNNMNNNINLYNINYNNNYINLINPINKNQNIKKEEQILRDKKEIKPQMYNIINNNDVKNLNPEDYLVKMFGRLGWICCQCNNFNFETRNKCNRCQAIKKPKLKDEIFKKKDNKKNKKKNKERKTDWLCLNCQNLNYGFRKNCNRCKIERKEDFPSIYLEPNQKINGNNNNMVLMNNYAKIQMQNGLSNNNMNKNASNFINNSINKNNNNANYSYNSSNNNNSNINSNSFNNNLSNNFNSFGINNNNKFIGYPNFYNNNYNNN